MANVAIQNLLLPLQLELSTGQRGVQCCVGTVEWCTQGGEKVAAQMSLERSSCMQEGLEEACGATLEEVPTTSACPMIQTTLHTNLGCKGGAMCTELSIRQGDRG